MFNSVQIFINIASYLSPSLKRRILILIPFLSISGFLEVVSLASIIPLGSALLNPKDDQVTLLNFLSLENLSNTAAITLFGLATMVLFCLKALIGFMINRYALRTSALAKAWYQSLIFRNYLGASFLFQMSRNSAFQIRNITTECNSLDSKFLTPSMVLVAEILPVIFIVCFLGYINFLGLLISTLFITISSLLIIQLTKRKLLEMGQLQLGNDGNLIKLAHQALHSSKEVYVYQRGKTISEVFDQHALQSSNAVAQALTISQIPRFLLEIMAIISLAIIALLSFQNTGSVDQLIIELGIFLGAMIKLLPSASRIVSHAQALNNARPTIVNILTELSEARASRHEYQDVEEPNQVSSFQTFTVNNLNFQFKGRPLFSNLSLSIKKGEVIGFIGETGVGKTTLINIILGLIPPDSGDVLVNGLNLGTVSKSWSDMVAYVPQEVYVIDDTVIKNIAYFPETKIDLERIKHVLKLVEMYDYFISLEDGLETVLAEHGSRLSGGQRQRIGIARALYRNPQILFLDEATSALDADTEKGISDLIESMKGTRTVIIIAHRLQSLAVCDRVYQLEKGAKIIELTSDEFAKQYLA